MLDGDPPSLLSQSTSLTVSKPERYEGHHCPVRWKLLIVTSLVAALIGAGGDLALVYWLLKLPNPLNAPLAFGVGFVVLPLVLVTLAGIFVYRHTARRRKLQATLTIILSLILTLAALLAAQIFL